MDFGSSNGFGLCGHKNSYNPNVKHGNWIEDNIGGELIQSTRPGKLTYETETRKHYVSPSEMPYHPNDTKFSVEEIKTKNKDGLPYTLVFNHSAKVDDRFRTSNQDACKLYDKYSLPAGSRNEERVKALRREVKTIKNQITEYQSVALRTGNLKDQGM